MQESIFDLFGSRHSTAQKHNARQATSVSSVHSLGGSATANLKQKSLSVGGPTPLKRALGDASNRLQQSRPLPGNEENQKPLSFSCQQKSPSLSNFKKTLSQKPCHTNEEPGLKNLTPALKNLTTMSAEVDSKPADVWSAKPEVFPGPEITEIEDDYEDFFPKNEQLTNDDIYRIIMSVKEAEEPKPLITPPDIMSLLPLPDDTVEDMQSFEMNLLMDIAEEQVSLPDILWEIEDKVYKNEDLMRHTL